MSTHAPTAADRVGAMDGLRGWAALSVVIFHFTWELWGHTRPEFQNVLLGLFGSGRLAVSIFFTLSGYVLTIRRWRRDDNPPFLHASARRYVRLTVPIFVASMIYWLLMTLNLTPTLEAGTIIGDVPPRGNFANFEPNILRAVWYSFVGVYLLVIRGAYNPFLWTMFFELWGSFILFALSQGWRIFSRPYIPLIILTLLWLWLFPQVACFFIGAIIALMQKDGLVFRAPPSQRESLIATIVFVAGVIGSAFMHAPTADLRLGNSWSLLPSTITGAIVVFAAVRSIPISQLLLTRASQAMGRLSFPLYLAHGIAGVCVAPLLIVWITQMGGSIDTIDAALIAAATILASLLLAQVLLPVETFTLGLVKRMSQRMAGTTR